jgi:hypothetical protein
VPRCAQNPEGRDTLYHFSVDCAPLESLLRTHREAYNEPDTVNPTCSVTSRCWHIILPAQQISSEQRHQQPRRGVRDMILPLMAVPHYLEFVPMAALNPLVPSRHPVPAHQNVEHVTLFARKMWRTNLPPLARLS